MSVPETNTPNPAAQYPDERSVPNAWLVRPCEAYNDEYKECTSIKGRFHQYFIEGDNADCSQWKKDFDSCMKFRATKDLVALEEVIRSENVRRVRRLAPFYANDVWKHRDSPPVDWNKPLPPKMQEEYRDTYLDHKAQEFKQTEG